ncbi:MAG: DUF1403 family protein [Litoreibacter sp.]
MKKKQTPLLIDPDTIPKMPDWVRAKHCDTVEEAAFLSGAALAQMHLVINTPHVPIELLRQRLALAASEVCVGIVGRNERAPDLRDEVHMLRPGDLAGPSGAIYLQWQRAVAQPVQISSLSTLVSGEMREHIPVWMRTAGVGSPVTQAAHVLKAVLADFPREEPTALILADAALAQAMGWRFIIPLLGTGLKRRHLRTEEEDLRRACHREVVTSAIEAARLAIDLTRRANKLRTVQSKLRAKGAEQSVKLFLSRDAIAPSSDLSRIMSDRSARRLCDRLVDLGAIRELTGRSTFRLYGV